MTLHSLFIIGMRSCLSLNMQFFTFSDESVSYKNDTSSLGTITLFTLNFFNKTAFCIKILSFSSITPSSFIVFTISTNSSLVAVTL